ARGMAASRRLRGTSEPRTNCYSDRFEFARLEFLQASLVDTALSPQPLPLRVQVLDDLMQERIVQRFRRIETVDYVQVEEAVRVLCEGGRSPGHVGCHNRRGLPVAEPPPRSPMGAKVAIGDPSHFPLCKVLAQRSTIGVVQVRSFREAEDHLRL